MQGLYICLIGMEMITGDKENDDKQWPRKTSLK